MERGEVLKEIRKYFDVEELVCDHTFAKWGERSWQFLDTGYLHSLLVIRRDIIGKPMYCNGKAAHQRGLRCNRCDMVRQKSSVYLSSHILGKAGDFTVPALKSAEDARNLIRAKADLLPYPIRLEKGVSWLHFDVLPQYGVQGKIYEFSE